VATAPTAISEEVVSGDTPGAPNGPASVGPRQPGQAAILRADPRTEYVSGGVGGSGQYYANLVRTLPWAIDDVTTDFGDDLYQRMLYDPQVASVVNVFKASILEDGIDLSSVVADVDADGYDLAATICDAATEMLAALDPDLDTVLWNLMDAIALGNRVAEQVYRTDGIAGKQGLALESLRVKPRHMTAFVVDSFLRVLGLVGFIPGVGAPLMQGYLIDPQQTPNLLPRQKFCVLSFRPKDNDPRGISVLRPAYTPWNLKQQVLREHVKYLTQFASPSLIGYTPENAQPAVELDPMGNPLIDPVTGLAKVAQSPEQLMNTQLVSFKNGTALSFPSGSKVDVLNNVPGGGTDFLAALERYDRDIVKAVLSQTLATEEGEHQARAAASVHEDVLDTIIRQAKRAVVRAFAWDVLRPWVAYNWGKDAARRLTPVPTLGHAEAPDLPTLWTAVAALKKSGYLAPSQYQALDETINLPARTAEELPAIEPKTSAPETPPLLPAEDDANQDDGKPEEQS